MKKIQQKWALFGLTTLVCLLGIMDTLGNKGTNAMEEDNVIISCVPAAYVGEVVKCNIVLDSNTITTYGISAKYVLDDKLSYVKLEETDDWKVRPDENYKDEEGFVLLSEGITLESTVAAVSYKIPEDASVGDNYEIGLTNIVIGDGNDTEINLTDVSANITIINNDNELSTINTLDDILFSVGSLNETFDKNVNNYTANVNVDRININVVKTDEKSTVTGDGEIMLVDGMNTINIVVTSESGISNTYVINIYKEVSLETEDYSYTFDDDLNVNYEKGYITQIKYNSLVSDLLDKVNVFGYNVSVFDMDNKLKDSNAILNTGDMLVIYKDQEIVKGFIIAISGDANGDGVVDLIDLVQIRKQIVGWIIPGTDKIYSKAGVYYDAIDFNADSTIDLIDLVRMRKTIVGWYDNYEED